jgi:hypothetical protein
VIYRPYIDLDPVRDPHGFLERLEQPIAPFEPPRVILVAWGGSTANAVAAMVRGGKHAQDWKYKIVATVVSVAGVMRRALLYDKAATGYLRREVEYGAAWYLLRHAAVTPADLDAARMAQRRTGDPVANDEDADAAYAAAFRREYGYAPNDVTLGRAADYAYAAYPFGDVPKVEDRKTGLVRVPAARTPQIRGPGPMPDH